METIGFYKGCEVKTDYGHHPTEIKNTLKALDEHKKANSTVYSNLTLIQGLKCYWMILQMHSMIVMRL